MARFPNRYLHLDEAPGSVDDYRLFRMSGEERLSEPFSFELTIRSQGEVPPAQAWIGASVTFSFGSVDNAERKVNGRCADFRHLHQKGRYVEFQIRVAAAFEALKLTRDRRIFNDHSAKQVIETVLGEHQVSFDDAKYGNSGRKAYIVQHDESDFDFVSRLMEDEGVFYYFKYEEGAAPFKHRMVLAGDPSGYFDGEPFDLAFRRDHLERGLHDLRMEYASAPAKVVTHDYNFRQPGELTPVTSPSRVGWAEKKGQIFQYAAGYQEPGTGQQRADLRAQDTESGSVTMRGQGTYTAFAPGARFNVPDPQLQPIERRIVVRGVRHSAFDPPISDEGQPYYHQDFEAHPSAQVFRPERPTPTPRPSGPQTAVVLDQNDPEGLGRVKVRFHWDHSGHSTAWVRVLQQWAGNGGIGAQWIPRPGTEVLIGFIENRIDLPYLAGCFYNGKQKPVFELPANLSQSGWQSSGPGGRSHHLFFEDKGGGEKIDLHSGHDLVRSADQDDTTFAKRHQEIWAKGIDMAGGESISIHVGRSKIVITDAGVWIDAPQINLNSGNAPQTFPPTLQPPTPPRAGGTVNAGSNSLAGGGGPGPGAGTGAGSSGSSTVGGGAAAPPMGIDKTLSPQAATLAAKSPGLVNDLTTLEKNGWAVQQGQAGAGSSTSRPDKTITMDPSITDPGQQVQTLAHETGHALYTPNIDTSSKQAYLNSTLADEGAATMSNIRDQRQIVANGGQDIGIAGNGTNMAGYNAAYDQYLKDGNAAAARQTIGQLYGQGEITSTTGQKYADYYGSYYDKKFGH